MITDSNMFTMISKTDDDAKYGATQILSRARVSTSLLFIFLGSC